MADATWPSISSALDATLASLDAINAEQRQRTAKGLAELATLTGRLGESTEPWTEVMDSPLPSRGQASPERRKHEPIPFVHLPERTTHGGPFGPKVRAKLIEEALR